MRERGGLSGESPLPEKALCSPCPGQMRETLLLPLQPASVRTGAHPSACEGSESNQRVSAGVQNDIRLCPTPNRQPVVYCYLHSLFPHPAFSNCHFLCSIFLLDLTYMTISDVSAHSFDCPHITSYPTHSQRLLIQSFIYSVLKKTLSPGL